MQVSNSGGAERSIMVGSGAWASAILLLLGSACGSIKDRTVDESHGGAGGASAATGGNAAAGNADQSSAGQTSGGSGGSSAGSSAAGEAGQAGEAGAPPSTQPPQCAVGELRCAGNTVEQCDPSHAWVALPSDQQCGGATPACSGAGTCSAFRLVSGTISPFGKDPAPSTAFVLRDQTLLGFPSVCNTDYCVSGSIRP